MQHERIHRDWFVERRQNILLGYKQIARFTVHAHPSQTLIVADRTNEVREPAQEPGERQPEDDCRKTAPNETLPRLLGTQLNQRRFAEEEAKHIRHHVVAHNHGNGHNEPDHALEYVLDD